MRDEGYFCVYKFGRKKKPRRKQKILKEKKIESAINTTSIHTIHI